MFPSKWLYKQRKMNNYIIVQLAVVPVLGSISPSLYKLVVCERGTCINSIKCCGLLTAAEWTDVCPWTQIRMQLHSTGVRHIHKHIFSPIDGHLWTRGCGKTLNILYATELCFTVYLALSYRASPATSVTCHLNWVVIVYIFNESHRCFISIIMT